MALTPDQRQQVEWALAAGVAVQPSVMAEYNAVSPGPVITTTVVPTPAAVIIPEVITPPTLVPTGGGSLSGGDYDAALRQALLDNWGVHTGPLSGSPAQMLAEAQRIAVNNGATNTNALLAVGATGFNFDDFYGGADGGLPGPVAATPAVGGALALAGAASAWALARATLGRVGRISAAQWGALPGWARSALSVVGITIGADLALDLPGVPGDIIPQINIPGTLASPFTGGADFPALHDHIVGGWVANGVPFYRLASGKLAVQNKKGRWKVWMPKKPTVLYNNGASSLQSFLKADKIIDRQAKKLAKALRRRAPSQRRSSGAKTVEGAVTNVRQG